MKRAVLVLACACGKPADKPLLGTAADISGEVTLVAGARRFALYGGDTWWQSDLGEQPAIGTAIARESARLGGLVDVFLGTTPIVVGGEEHREEYLRITSSVTPIDFDGHPAKVLALRDREAWLARTGIVDQVVFVVDTHVEATPKLALVGPPVEAASPVSARLCATPKVEDIAALGDEVYALVTECNDDAPMRIVVYPSGRVAMLPSRKHLAMTFVKLAVSPDGKMHLAGIRDGRFGIEHVIDQMPYKRSLAVTTFAATRVEAAVVADDGAFWALVLDAESKPQVLRNGARVPLTGTPRGLALGDKLGVVVLVDGALLAERPGARVVIAPRR